MTRTTTRLDAELVRRGLARSRGRAAELVARGAVSVAGSVARKPSQHVLADADLDVSTDDRDRYVSRAARKLAGALDALDTLVPGGMRVDGARCLDAGASTGGFTQVLLERGAARVHAVDVGHGQIASVVADDPRVVVREGTNVRGLTPADLDGPLDVVVADLSFISLTTVLPALLGVVGAHGSLLVMVKPQFEVGRHRLGASGVVTSPALRAEAVLRVAATAEELGADVRAVVPSPLPGPAGNREYFLWLAPSGAGGAPCDVPGGARAGMGAESGWRPGTGPRVGHPTVRDAVRAAVHDDVPVLIQVVDPGSRP